MSTFEPATAPEREELQAFLDARLAQLDIRATTRTPSGQIIDWIDRSSQVPGGEIASPPPDIEPLPSGALGADAQRPQAELDDPAAERGPEGTVPVLRPNPSERDALRHLLTKKRANTMLAGAAAEGPSVDYQGHHYANSGQNLTCYGGQGTLSCFVPQIAAYGDFSLIQIGVVNTELGYMQTVEAGWIVDPQQDNNSYGANLFLFYTTTGYNPPSGGNNQGGWNRTVTGWVQYDPSWFPGMTFSPTSVVGGAQYEITIRYQLYNGNWWFNVQNHWLGYYPGSLYTNQNARSTMANHANTIGFWGEIYDLNNPPTTKMGSGQFCSGGWTRSAYMHNLLVQTNANGTMSAYDGSPSETDPTLYTICPDFASGSNWASYMYLGGPGA